MEKTDVAASGGHEAAPGGLVERLGNAIVRWPWLVIASWIVLAVALSVLVPPLAVVAARNQASPVPEDSPVMVTSREMTAAFHEAQVSPVMVVLTDEKGLSPADEETYRKLVDNLRADTADKLSVQDFLTTPPLREIFASKDNKAWNLPITIPGDVSQPPVQVAYRHIAQIVQDAVKGTTLTANLTGPVASMADITAVSETDAHLIEIGTGLMVLLILLVIYRNLVTMLIPLITIAVSVVTAQGVVSALALMGLDVNMQTIILMSAVMVGGGVDYAVFLISRYHDYVRHGAETDEAVKKAMMSIGKVIAASAATVAVTFLAMIFCELQVFSAVGPAISVSILVAFLAAVTLIPAILVLAGRRGWVKPRRDLTSRLWRRSGIRIVRKPRIHLVGSLIVLAILAGCTTMARFNYDDLKTLPDSLDSVRGMTAMDRHFPANAMSPEMLFIQSPHDLRTPAALADLEMMAHRVSQLPNIVMVRGLTRPTGQSLEQTKLSFQAGEVGGKLGEASTAIKDHGGDLDHLAGGADQLAKALAEVRGQVTQAVAGVSMLVNSLSYMQGVMGSDKTLKDLGNSANLAARMRALGDALSANLLDTQNTIGWAGPMLNALNASPICDADPNCRASRAQLQELVAARNNGNLSKIEDLARNLQSTQEFQTISATVNGLRNALNTAVGALQAAGSGIQAKISQLQQGAGALADGSRAVADGVQALVDQTKKLGSGLNEASAFLLTMKRDANKQSMAGFNIPAQAMSSDDFKKGAQIFLSPDGHSARYLVQSAIPPATTEAMDQVDSIVAAARSAQPNTELADAKISLAGIPTGLRDIRDYYNDDIQFIVIATIVIVFLILVVLLRALVAPLYLIVSVLISYLSALGVGVLVFQFIFDQGLHWSLPGLTFILLVAVGADYNMLLISRIRDESPHGVRVGVIRTVGSTGGVITSAGLIFAASMFGLLTASITTMVEAGFIIGIGIVIDTFLVRTVTVPAVAAMLGQKNWWPSRPGQSTVRQSKARLRARKYLDRLPRVNAVLSRRPGKSASAAPTTAPSDRARDSDDLLPLHALPLFGLNGLGYELVEVMHDSAPDCSNINNGNGNGNGKRLTDEPPCHSLPLFALNGHTGGNGKAVSVLRTDKQNANGSGNGSGNGNGNGRGTHAVDHHSDHALPLFGLSAVTPISEKAAGISEKPANGKPKRPVARTKKAVDKPVIT